MFSNGGIKSRRSPHARDYVTGAFECAAYANRYDIAVPICIARVRLYNFNSLSHTHINIGSGKKNYYFDAMSKIIEQIIYNIPTSIYIIAVFTIMQFFLFLFPIL